MPVVTLTVGVGSQVPGDVDGRVVQLPACATCKAQEYLVRSEAGGGSPHQALVDQLHSQLARAGRVA